ncbi:MAG: 2-C-methyl-D-erythritol 4-phosphate cytidylyltransferase [Acidobacteria bacterium]|nr:2-C-methyl-D-erythritol 4-phosphate cytidylyltransferase [Acidobacteriota bacterium]
MKVSVIIPAAGLGTRMIRPAAAGDPPPAVARKQFLLLDGEPILAHTLRKFMAAPSVAEIVIALRPEDRDWARELLARVEKTKPVRFADGGNSRHQSVENALAILDHDTDLVAVHDAVRPFVSVETIEKVIAEAEASGAAIVGIVPVDTVKQVHLNHIRATIPRERLILAQTPQIFRFDLLRQAFDHARSDQFTGTDEASLVERLEQVQVVVVPGSDRNIKITKPADLELAKLYLAQEKADSGKQEA